MSGAGALRHRLAFDAPSVTRNALGEDVPGDWVQRHRTWGALIYQAGGEDIAAGREASRQVLKVKIRTGTGAREIRTGWRLRLLPDGSIWNVTEADAFTQRGFVFLKIEGPEAPPS